MAGFLAIVAILKNEDPFVDEWIAYHRILGADEFILYDDDPRQHLRHLVRKHDAYVKVFDWNEPYNIGPGRDKQTRAYEHALKQTTCCWVAFIDGDEFIVLRKHESFHHFLAGFGDANAVILTWHMFGHNGHFDNPKGLIVDSLTKRQALPGRMMKSIVQREAVQMVESAHVCKVFDKTKAFDANRRQFEIEHYQGKTEVAHINHYFCRSFTTWMERVERGCLSYPLESYPEGDAWRFNKEACLRKFVEISSAHNEVRDTYLQKYGLVITNYLGSLL